MGSKKDPYGKKRASNRLELEDDDAPDPHRYVRSIDWYTTPLSGTEITQAEELFRAWRRKAMHDAYASRKLGETRDQILVRVHRALKAEFDKAVRMMGKDREHTGKLRPPILHHIAKHYFGWTEIPHQEGREPRPDVFAYNENFGTHTRDWVYQWIDINDPDSTHLIADDDDDAATTPAPTVDDTGGGGATSSNAVFPRGAPVTPSTLDAAVRARDPNDIGVIDSDGYMLRLSGGPPTALRRLRPDVRRPSTTTRPVLRRVRTGTALSATAPRPYLYYRDFAPTRSTRRQTNPEFEGMDPEAVRRATAVLRQLHRAADNEFDHPVLRERARARRWYPRAERIEARRRGHRRPQQPLLPRRPQQPRGPAPTAAEPAPVAKRDRVPLGPVAPSAEELARRAALKKRVPLGPVAPSAEELERRATQKKRVPLRRPDDAVVAPAAGRLPEVARPDFLPASSRRKRQPLDGARVTVLDWEDALPLRDRLVEDADGKVTVQSDEEEAAEEAMGDPVAAVEAFVLGNNPPPDRAPGTMEPLPDMGYDAGEGDPDDTTTGVFDPTPLGDDFLPDYDSGGESPPDLPDDWVPPEPERLSPRSYAAWEARLTHIDVPPGGFDPGEETPPEDRPEALDAVYHQRERERQLAARLAGLAEEEADDDVVEMEAPPIVVDDSPPIVVDDSPPIVVDDSPPVAGDDTIRAAFEQRVQQDLVQLQGYLDVLRQRLGRNIPQALRAFHRRAREEKWDVERTAATFQAYQAEQDVLRDLIARLRAVEPDNEAFLRSLRDRVPIQADIDAYNARVQPLLADIRGYAGSGFRELRVGATTDATTEEEEAVAAPIERDRITGWTRPRDLPPEEEEGEDGVDSLPFVRNVRARLARGAFEMGAAPPPAPAATNKEKGKERVRDTTDRMDLERQDAFRFEDPEPYQPPAQPQPVPAAFQPQQPQQPQLAPWPLPMIGHPVPVAFDNHTKPIVGTKPKAQPKPKPRAPPQYRDPEDDELTPVLTSDMMGSPNEEASGSNVGQVLLATREELAEGRALERMRREEPPRGAVVQFRETAVAFSPPEYPESQDPVDPPSHPAGDILHPGVAFRERVARPIREGLTAVRVPANRFRDYLQDHSFFDEIPERPSHTPAVATPGGGGGGGGGTLGEVSWYTCRAEKRDDEDTTSGDEFDEVIQISRDPPTANGAYVGHWRYHKKPTDEQREKRNETKRVNRALRNLGQLPEPKPTPKKYRRKRKKD